MTSTTLTQITAASGQDVPINANFQTVSPGALFARRYGSGISGLVLGYYGGTFEGNDIADGTTTLAASQATIYVVALKSTGAVSSSTSNANWNDTTNYFRIGIATTGPSTITAFLDKRQAYSAQAGSSFSGGNLASALNEAPAVTIASAATVNIGAAAANTINVTGTTTITAFDSIGASAVRRIVFGGILTLTHNATSLILPTGANITTAAGDVAEFVSLGSGNWRCINYMRASGNAVAGASFTGGTLTSALNEAPQVTIASASTVNIGAAAANSISISGTTAITAFDSIPSGAVRRLVFQGALTLTHNASSLILPTGANITTAAGDVAWMESLGSGNWRCVGYHKANGQAVAGGAALTNWTEAVSSTSPNATVPVASFTATNAATDVDAAIIPKGQGALLRQVPTGTSSGGNKRGGTYVVDWQGFRSAADQVASGSGSVIGGGTSNKASAATATVAGGDSNLASNTSATVAGGSSNTANATFSAVAGGVSNTASGSAAFAAGSTNTASGLYSVAYGRNNTAGGTYSRAAGYGSTARGLVGADVYSSYYNGSTVGKHQRGQYTLVARTTDATPAAMTADLTAAGAANQLVLANSMAVAVSGLVTARKSGTNDYSTWSFTAAVIRDSNAASTIVTAAAPVVIAASAGAAAWAFAISADTTNGGLRLTVTGAAATTVSWTAALQTAEVFEV